MMERFPYYSSSKLSCGNVAIFAALARRAA